MIKGKWEKVFSLFALYGAAAVSLEKRNKETKQQAEVSTKHELKELKNSIQLYIST